MLYLKLQEGKDAMKFKEYVGEIKAQAACTKRLAVGSETKKFNKDNKEDEPEIADVYIGDSWFASVQATIALTDKG